MKSLLKFVCVFCVSLFFIGCASTGPKYTEIMPTVPFVASDTGRIYIYRTAVFGAAVQPDVKLNGEVVGSAVPRGFFYVDRKPGIYEILTSTEVDRKLSLLLENGQTRFVRLNISMGFFMGHVYPELIDPDIAEKEIKDCYYTGTDIKSSKNKKNK